MHKAYDATPRIKFVNVRFVQLFHRQRLNCFHRFIIWPAPRVLRYRRPVARSSRGAARIDVRTRWSRSNANRERVELIFPRFPWWREQRWANDPVEGKRLSSRENSIWKSDPGSCISASIYQPRKDHAAVMDTADSTCNSISRCQ